MIQNFLLTYVAEQERFELSLGYSPTDGFQDHSLQPLGYCSMLVKKPPLRMAALVIMVGTTGLEPVTFRTSSGCSPS